MITTNKINRVSKADSYKYSHASQYPKMDSMYDYMSSRGGLYPATVWIGLQGLMQEYFDAPIEQWEVDQAYRMSKAHGVPFDKKGWDYIVNELGGKLPVRIRAVKEGSLIPIKMVLLTVESLDKNVPWIAGWLETILLKLWYPTTIATKSFYVRQMLEKYGSPAWAMFAYHNFGDRGSSSVESAAIGGMAHLSQFMGTDNFNSLFYIEDNYGVEGAAGFSVFATEHSTTTAWGRNGEMSFVLAQLLENPNANIMSFVADSYDVFKFTQNVTQEGSEIRIIVESRKEQKFVLRPDSGNPLEVIPRMLEIMTNNDIKYIMTPTGKLFTDYGILWGDGVTPENIEAILQMVLALGYAAENMVFGSGGDLMQNVNRDTQRFAIKCSSITVDDGHPFETGNIIDGEHEMEWQPALREIDVFKDPITDPGKKSLKGRITTYFNKESKTYFVDKVGQEFETSVDILETIWENGEFVKTFTFDEIRENSRAA